LQKPTHIMPEPNTALVAQIFERAEFVRSLGITLVAFGYGWCETSMAVAPAISQQHGYVHAGALMTLADHTCGGAAASTVPADKDVLTIDNNFSFLRAAAGDVLKCRASVIRTGSTVAFVEARIDVMRDGVATHIVSASSILSIVGYRPRN